jgi:prolyl 4-hydroxylase
MILIKDKPFVASFRNFLSGIECEEILSTSLSFSRSRGSDPITAQGNIVKERTSSTARPDQKWENRIKNKIYDKIKFRFENNPFSIDHLENLQMQLYEYHQEYKPHFDFFNSNESVTIKNDRIATAIIYLNEGFSGGETWFPRLNLTVKPEIGKMLYFEYKYSRDINELTEHAGCPVLDGEKFIITSWIRESVLK